MSAEIEQVTLALTTINKVEMGLTDLRQKYEGVVFDVSTGVGMEVAKEARRDVREPRLEVERIRKAAKAPILALGKKLDSEAARITAELEKLEGPIHLQITTEETRKEAEKERRLAAEIARVAALQERIAELRGCQMLSPSSGSQLVLEHIADLEAIPVDATFDEFEQQASDAKTAALVRLNGILGAAVAHEAEQAKVIAERAELARLRAAEEERQATARAEQAERDRLAKIEADRIAAEERAKQVEAARAHAAELKAQRDENERIAAEAKAKLDAEAAEQKRVNEIERQRIADEKTENDRANEAERQRQADETARVAEERRKLEADQAAHAEAQRKASEPKPPPLPAARPSVAKTPDREEIVEAVAKAFDAPVAIARYWLCSIRWDRAA
jgi:hypothetical protein